jgi:pyruvate dehydrogenase E2 component (dihydrolipoamide acetyltransferase)
MPEVLMPRLSDTMEEGALARWLKKEGDEVHRGDVLAEIETDKATMDLEAFDDGVLEKLLVAEGTLVPIGQPLAIIGDGSGATAAPAAPATPAPEAPPESDAPAPDSQPENVSQPALSRDVREGTVQPASSAEPDWQGAPELRASPLSRRVARDHGIDLASIQGSGPRGRIVRADVEAAIAAREQEPEGAEPPPLPDRTPAPRSAPPFPDEDLEVVPLNAIRRVTARRLTESQAVPHFFLTSVIDASRLIPFRAEVNERLAAAGTKVSVTDLLVRACAVALRQHPQVNASWGEDSILLHRRINIGVAVSLENGLIVPVVRDADRKTLSEIAAEIRALATRAREGKLQPPEFTGGTFTISNLGMFGIDQFTAVINPPEAAILAVGAATEEPAVRDGRLVTVPKITLTLTVDHRVLDGASAAAFMRDLKAVLEEPLRIVV